MKAKDNEEEKSAIKAEVRRLCEAFPVPETFT